jgi:hypothetical protein
MCSNSAKDAKCPSRPDGSRLAVRGRYSLSQFVDFGVRDIPPGSIGTRAPRPIKKSENQDIGRGLRNIGIIRGESAT